MENKNHLKVSVVLPCQNEEQSIGDCVLKIHEVFKRHDISGEIIVSDSSTDTSPEIVRKLNVKLVEHGKNGYGNAYLEGFKAVSEEYIFCADPDGTYDFGEIPRFLECLKSGYDLVIGNRLGGIEKGTMPWLHRYVGTPILSLFLRIFFGSKLHDINCGMRAIKKDSLGRLDLRTTGMEFASEMIIEALKNKLKIEELPISYYPRNGISKLKTFRDGWRHARLIFWGK